MGILDRAELLLQAKNYSGSGDWLDESGNGHDAQFGSTSGADTNDPLFKPWNGTDYLYLPGTSGNYISTADVNLLDADTAHLHQSKGSWSYSQRTDAGASGLISDGGTFGDNSLHVVSTGLAGVSRINSSLASWIGDVTPGTTEVALAFDIELVSGPDSFDIVLDWGAGAGANQYYNLANNATAGVKTGTLTVPSGASASGLGIFIQQDVDATVCEYRLKGCCVQVGTSASFVPSIRIVGDLDIETKLNFATDNTAQWPVARWDGGTAYQAFIFERTSRTADDLVLYWYDGSTTRSATVGHTLSTGTTYTLRATLDVDNGSNSVVRFYVDGVQLGSDQTGAQTQIQAATSNVLAVGRDHVSHGTLNGDIYYVTIRDGIDGPVVAEYRASDAVEPFATQTGATDGRTWTYNRSASGLVSTVVDRDMFLLSTDDYFEIADDDALDVGVGDSLTFFAVVAPTRWTNGGRLLSKRPGSGAGYDWNLQDGSTALMDGFVSDGTNSNFGGIAPTGTPTNNTYVVLARSVLHGDTQSGWIDGVPFGSPRDISAVTGSLANSTPLWFGRWNGGSYYEGKVVAVALFREALSDNAIKAIGNTLKYELADPTGLHGDALFNWLQTVEAGNFTSLEVVGALNELNGTSGVEYAQARGTYLGIAAAG